MTDRDRLIELIGQADKKCADTKQCEMCKAFGKGANCVDHNIADYLLANGVIVPPCKVGDTVYFDAVGYHDSAEIDGIHIDAQGMSFTWVQYDVGVDITELWDEGDFDIEDIGKTVFLTKEEAERALKESEGNG